MQNKHISLLLLGTIFLLLTACTTTPNTPPVPSDVTNGTATTQGSIDDDLEATLEEAVLTLSTHVSDMISKVNNLGTPEGTDSDKRNQYHALEHELEQLDKRIDELDDTLDNNMKTGKISFETFEKLHRELDSFEELVDSAENKIDRLFGFDD